MDGIVNGEERLRGVEQGLAVQEKDLSLLENTVTLRREHLDTRLGGIEATLSHNAVSQERHVISCEARLRALEDTANGSKWHADAIVSIKAKIVNLEQAPGKLATMSIQRLGLMLGAILTSVAGGYILHMLSGAH